MAVFDCAVWRPISANTGGALHPIGLVLHHAVAEGSLHSFFNSPAAEVSAHFWVARDGTVEQYVDSERVAWHGRDLNGQYCGVETEGCSAPPHAEPMTEPMVAGLAAVYAEGAGRHGWPNALAEQAGQPGFGYHRMPGGVNTACPCDIRLARRPDILALAFGGTTAGPPPAPEDDPMIPAPCVFVTADDVQQVFYVDSHGQLAHHYAGGDGRWHGETLGAGWDPDTGLAHALSTAGAAQVWGTRADGRRAQCYWNGRQWVTQLL